MFIFSSSVKKKYPSTKCLSPDNKNVNFGILFPFEQIFKNIHWQM